MGAGLDAAHAGGAGQALGLAEWGRGTRLPGGGE